ncbi:MAG: MFS transporter [Candidatus Dormibacteria bacterium]
MGTPNQRKAGLGVSAALAALLGVTMLMRASQNMAQTTFPLVAGDLLRLSATAVGAMAAAGSGISVLAMVLLASRIPPRRVPIVLVGSLLLLGLAFPLVAVARTGLVLTVGVLLLGAGGGLAFPTLITAVGGIGGEDAEPGARDRPIALLGVALSASLAIGPFVETASLAVSGGSLRAAFLWFTLGPLLAALLMAGVVTRRSGWYRSRQAVGRQRRAGGEGHADTFRMAAKALAAGDGVGATAGPGSSRVSFRQALTDPAFQVALLGQLLYAAPFAALIVFGALFARHDYQLSPAQIQVAFGVFFLISFAVRVGVAWRSPILHKLAWFRWSTVATLVGLAAIGMGHGELQLLLAMALLGVPHGLTFPLSMALVAEDRAHAELPSVNAHLTASVQAVNLALPLVLGLGIDALGFRTTFLLLLLPVAAAGLAQHRLGRRTGL